MIQYVYWIDNKFIEFLSGFLHLTDETDKNKINDTHVNRALLLDFQLLYKSMLYIAMEVGKHWFYKSFKLFKVTGIEHDEMGSVNKDELLFPLKKNINTKSRLHLHWNSFQLQLKHVLIPLLQSHR